MSRRIVSSVTPSSLLSVAGLDLAALLQHLDDAQQPLVALVTHVVPPLRRRSL